MIYSGTKYFQFPLFIWKDLFIDRKRTMNTIITIGLYKYHDNLDGEPEERMKYAMAFYGLTNDIQSTIQQGSMIVDSIPKGEPWPMINRDLVIEFRDNDKTEHDLVQLSAYIAIRSILGKDRCCKTNKKHLHARMFGFNTYMDLIKSELNPIIKALGTKYSPDNRYRWDNLLMDLQLYWDILIYGGEVREETQGVVKKKVRESVRGYWVGVKSKHLDMDTFILSAKRNQRQAKINKLERKKKAAIKKANDILESSP